MFPCTPLVYSLGALCSFFIYILLFTDQKKKKASINNIHSDLLQHSETLAAQAVRDLLGNFVSACLLVSLYTWNEELYM